MLIVPDVLRFLHACDEGSDNDNVTNSFDNEESSWKMMQKRLLCSGGNPFARTFGASRVSPQEI